MSTQVTVIGNIGQDPVLEYSQSGIPRLSFSVGSSKRVKDGDNWVDGPTSWRRVTAWRGLAEGLAEQLAKGKRVIVIGDEQVREYEKDGVKRLAVEVTAEHVALYLFPKRQDAPGAPRNASTADSEPWANPGAQSAFDSDVPF